MDGAYKRKSQKIQLIDQKLLDGSKPDESNTWRVNVMKKEIFLTLQISIRIGLSLSLLLLPKELDLLPSG